MTYSLAWRVNSPKKGQHFCLSVKQAIEARWGYPGNFHKGLIVDRGDLKWFEGLKAGIREEDKALDKLIAKLQDDDEDGDLAIEIFVD